jgi:hypothetical protein
MVGSADAEVSAIRRIRRQNIPWDSAHQGQSALYHGGLESPEVVMAINRIEQLRKLVGDAGFSWESAA